MEDWFDIPTPHFKKILDYQNFEPMVQRWMYVMIGRLIYPLLKRDRWQARARAVGLLCVPIIAYGTV